MHVSKSTRGKLSEIHRKHQDELLQRPNVVGVSIAEKVTRGVRTGRPALTAYVRRKLPARTRLNPGDRIEQIRYSVIVAAKPSFRVSPWRSSSQALVGSTRRGPVNVSD
jgi:hypothetical protein